MKNIYTLPDLKYGYKDLEPYISEEQLKIHHLKHHQAYVNNANALLEKLESARKDNSGIDMKSVLKDLSFNIGGHVLHSYFWDNMEPARKNNAPSDWLLGKIKENFESFERFKDEFGKAALSVEGSGWAALSYCKKNNKLLIAQIEKHNANLYPDFRIIMVIDVFEHAYYLDYKNDRAKFIEGFWNLANWKEIERRMK